MTWGQFHIWRPLQWFGEASAAFNIKRRVPLPDGGVPLAACRTALRRLIETHQSLRTHFTEGPEGPWQTAAATGTHLVDLHRLPDDAGPDAVEKAAEERAAELARAPFRLDTQWPVRFGLVCRGDQVHAVVVVTSHVGADGWGILRLALDLEGLLAARDAPKDAAPAAVWQPLDQAAHEQSAGGRRQHERAMKYWRARLAELPDAAPARPLTALGDPPVQRWFLQSTALAAASVELGRRTATSSSTVLLTLAAAALSALRAEPVVALQLISGNRYSVRQRQLVAAAAQDALLVFRRADVPLEDAVRAVHRRATEGYFNGQYDPRAQADMLDEVRRSRSHPVDLSGYFNDARLGRDWGLPETSGVDPLTLRSAQGPRFAQGFQKHDMTYCLALFQRGTVCEVSLLVNTGLLAADRIPAFLTGLELLLCEAVERPVALDEIPGRLGVQGAAGAPANDGTRR